MQIICTEDKEFNDLLDAWKNSKTVGRYWRNEKIQIVAATSNLLLVTNGENPDKIAIKPARSQQDAENMGQLLLTRERERGNRVEVE